MLEWVRVSPAIVLLVAACADTKLEQVPATDEQVSGIVVTANPHATKAGADILRAGGSAVDAAIAIEAVLSLVEPQSSGLAGGGFMIHFDNRTNALTVYDGRETAPASATANMFLDDAGKELGFLDAKHSGISTGVPGVVSMLQIAHEDHGKLPWGSQFDEASRLAQNGFAVSPRLYGFLKLFKNYLPRTAEDGPLDARNYFYDDQGEPHPVGYLLRNTDYAVTLAAIASNPRNFYEGQIAADIEDKVQMAPRAGGLTQEDIAAYQATRREALCVPYRENLLCGPPPPSSWVAVGMIAGLLQRGPGFSAGGAQDAGNWAIFGEAQRLAYADRDRFVADTAFESVPIEGMLTDSYLSERAQLITEKAIKHISPGNPWSHQGVTQSLPGVDNTHDVAGTTHFVVVDGAGDVVSMTASVESIFGSARMSGGMFLNNQLTDFSRTPTDSDGNQIANAVAPNKQPRSSMSPTIVLDKNGELLMATGSPGGNSIIAYTAKTLVGVLDWGLSAQEAINLPNLVARGDVIRIEGERADTTLVQALREFGWELEDRRGENSGLSVVVRHPDGRLEGGVDPRREGVIEMVNNH